MLKAWIAGAAEQIKLWLSDVSAVLKQNSFILTNTVTLRELSQMVNRYVEDYNNVWLNETLEYKVPDEFYFGCFAA